MTNVSDTQMTQAAVKPMSASPTEGSDVSPSASASPFGSNDVKAILKAELKRRSLTYADLVVRLADHGVIETEANLRNKISRGAFTATFFMQCLIAAGCDHFQISPPKA